MEFKEVKEDKLWGEKPSTLSKGDILRPTSAAELGAKLDAVMAIIRRPKQIIALFDGEIDDFLALGRPLPNRTVITAGPKPDFLARELQRGAHYALPGLPTVTGSQIEAAGGMDPILGKDATPAQVSARARAMYETLTQLTVHATSARLDSGTDVTMAAGLSLLLRYGVEAARLAFQHQQLKDTVATGYAQQAAAQFEAAFMRLQEECPPTGNEVVVVATSLAKKSVHDDGPLEIGGANFAANPFAALVLVASGVEVVLSHRSQSGPISSLTPSCIARQLQTAQTDAERGLWEEVQQLPNSFFESTGPVARRSASFNLAQFIKWAERATRGDASFSRWDTLTNFLEELTFEQDRVRIDEVLVGDPAMEALVASADGTTPLDTLEPHLFAQKPAQTSADASGMISMLNSIIKGFNGIAEYEAVLTGPVDSEPIPVMPDRVMATVCDPVSALNRRLKELGAAANYLHGPAQTAEISRITKCLDAARGAVMRASGQGPVAASGWSKASP
ncbi:hypothetical protein FGG08_002524 [Glutinoglossum americanum]|uniref:Uncharacterized protein n=1 Tax=Glutinoglossum americanum TaxID=1670608 RepID=A0A9P8ICN6_9PEZI|nr:hypothetical protein FGG08_002524 [Glutinoglossum americanum]